MSPELDPNVALHHLRATWFEEGGLGFDGSTIRPQLFPLALGAFCFRKIGLSAEMVCRLWYALLFILQGVGVAALAANVLRRPLPRQALVAIAAFAVINPYELISLHGPYLTTQLSVAAIPALLTMAIRYMRSRRLPDFLACLFIMALAATGDANPAVFLVETTLLFSVALVSVRQTSFIPANTLAVAYLGINSIWIAPSYLTLKHDLPFLAPASAQYSDDTLRVVSQFSAWPHSIRLVGEYLFFNNVAGHPYLSAGTNYDSNVFLVVFTCIIPACALIGFLSGVRRRETEILTIGVIGMVALFLAKGTSPPFGTVFVFLNDHSILFRGFRDSFAKFEWVVVIAYALLLGRFLQASAGLRRPQLRTVLWSLLLSAVLVSGYPILIGQLFWSHVVVRIPDRYFQLASFLNGQTRFPTVAEVPLAPDVFDSYRWGYVGAGINAQLIKGPLLSGATRLLSPINDRLADLLEHENSFSSDRASSWLGLYGFNGILGDTTSDTSIFAPNEASESFPRHVPGSQTAWEQGGLSYVTLDGALVNPRVYAASTVIAGTNSVRQIALSCVVIHSCKAVAFAERLITGGGFTREAVLTRKPLYWFPKFSVSEVRSGTHVFVDDATNTYEVLRGSHVPQLQTVFPTYPVMVRIADAGVRPVDVDAYVTGTGSSRETVHLCVDPNMATEFEIKPESRENGFGLLALSYDGDPTAGADLIISSSAGPLQVRLSVGSSRKSIVRTLPLGPETRARIVLEPRPTRSCVNLFLFSFAKFLPLSPLTKFASARGGEPTLYQRANPDPLKAYVDASKIVLSPRCTVACAHHGGLGSSLRDLPLHDVTPGSHDYTTAGREYCASAEGAVFRGENLRLIPGLRYVLSLRVASNSAARVRTAILSEDELGVAEGAKDIGSSRAETVTLPFVASGSLQNAVAYAWIDPTPYGSKTCILSATLREDAPDSDLDLRLQNINLPIVESTETGDGSYRVRLFRLGHMPSLVVLNQTYDDRWMALAPAGTRLEHVSVNGGVNGWVVRGSDNTILTLRYLGSDVTRLWLDVGIFFLVNAFVAAVYIARVRVSRI